MSSSAIVMMILAIAVIWGGLVWACVRLMQNPEGSVELLDDDGRPLEVQPDTVRVRTA